MNKNPVLIIRFLLFLNFNFIACTLAAGDVTIIESRHYSTVFGETRYFRIFLPPAYFENPQKRYPVIYFFHGWSQRYFGSVGQEYAGLDKGDQNNGDNIANFVSNHEVIVVKVDGYNRNPDEKYYVRPWNVSPVETFRQFPIYFPELVSHIDANYNTIADRNHRAVSGLSMGGFMTFWIAGKYPQLVSAAGNFCGSAEFEIGPKDFPVEYRHIDMYKNYAGLNLRLNYGDKDFIRYYHRDLNKVWTQVLDNYEYKIYEAAHSTCGMGEMFGFLMRTFENPPQKPVKWNHIDVYPEFSVWDYQVSSDRIVPGFTILENVDNRGFRCSVRQYLPDGELLPFVNVSITTPAIYEKNQSYIINDIDPGSPKNIRKTIKSDGTGRIKINMNGGLHEIGINKLSDKPNICIASYRIVNMNWATHSKDVSVSIKLLNKGLENAEGLKAILSATRQSAIVTKNESEFPVINVNESQDCQIPFIFNVQTDSIEIEKFMLEIRDKNKNGWIEFIEIPVRKDLPEIKDFVIADGKEFIVAKGGNALDTILLGAGNGDGIANPGESLVILVKDQNKLWRSLLHCPDKYVNPFGINIRMSDNWSNYDHVGASAKYSIPVISSDCPQDHIIEGFAEYWLPDYPNHIIKQGNIKIKVSGKDTTTPKLQWVKIPGDNIIQVKLYDGSRIRNVKAKLTSIQDPNKIIDTELKDDGISPDRAREDNVFSTKIPEQKYGNYRLDVEATDSNGNKMVEKGLETFILY